MLNEVVIANKNYAVMNVAEESLDMIALNVLRQDCPPFVQAVRLMDIDGETQLRNELTGGIRLAYIPLKMGKQDLNRLLLQLLAPAADCVDWFLDYHNLCFDRNYIFVDQEDYRVRYVYLPVKQMQQTEEEVMAFFRDLVMEIELYDEPGYTTVLLRCIMGKGASILSLSELVKGALAVTGKQWEAQHTDAKQTFAESPKKPFFPESAEEKRPAFTEKPEEKKPSLFGKAEEKKVIFPAKPEETKQPETPLADREFGKNDLASIVGKGLFGEEGKPAKDKKEKKPKEKKEKNGDLFGKLLGGTKKKGDKPAVSRQSIAERAPEQPAGLQKSDRQQYPASLYQPEDSYSDRTQIGDEEEEAQDGALYLVLDSAPAQPVPERIMVPLERGYAVMGRVDKTGRVSADFNFDMSLTYIGRRHLRIEKEGDSFYVIDLESKNHTYLNGEELLPNHRYPLKRGDRIGITRRYNIIYRVC